MVQTTILAPYAEAPEDGETAEHPKSAMTPPKPPDRSDDAQASFAGPIGSDFARRLAAIIWQHHSHTIMNEELLVCPVCTDPKNKEVLDQLWDAFHPNTQGQARRP